MASRKAWDDLSPAYRKRLQRFGVTKRSHSAGEPLWQARGHFPRDPKAGRVNGFARAPEQRQSYRDSSAKWNEVRKDARFRDLPSPVRDTLRQAIFVDRKYTDSMVYDVLQMYSDAKRSFESDPRKGERQDVYTRLDAEIFEFEAFWAEYDYDWFDDLEVWYH
jgi:hypothetical protein